MNDPAHRSRFGATLVLACIRLSLVLTIAAAELAETPIELHAGAYESILGAAVLWSVLLLAVAIGRKRETIAPWEGLVDLALLGGLSYATGGPYSDVRQAFFVVPVIAAATQTPRTTAYWGLAAILTFSLASMISKIGGLPGGTETMLASDLYLIAVGVVCVLTSLLIWERASQVRAYGTRARLLSQKLLEAEERERRDLAIGLHDGPVQELTGAQLEIGRARRSLDPEGLDRISAQIAKAEGSLRETAFNLYPDALEELGLCEAIHDVAADACERAGMDLRIDCDSLAATPQDGQLFAITRELISNATRHSGGTTVDVRVETDDGSTRLFIADDGCGVDPDLQAKALRRGHLGLVSVRERANAIGASLSFRSGVDGTKVTVHMPAPQRTADHGSAKVPAGFGSVTT